MKKNISTLLLTAFVSLLAIDANAQNNKYVWEPFLYGSSVAGKKESKEITSLRNSFQQFMLSLLSSYSYNFSQIRSASNITIGSSEEESLQYLVETSEIIRRELLEQLPDEMLLDGFRNYNPPVSSTKQGMILGLQKDLELYSAQMANAPK